MESKSPRATISRRASQVLPVLKRTGKQFLYWPRIPVLLLISLYQKTISPDHGVFRKLFPYGYCKYHPTCSEYGKQAIKKYGLIRGVPMAAWRVIRCNPWSDGGEDWP
jgi:putative membrane protein insertion efficiency factor